LVNFDIPPQARYCAGRKEAQNRWMVRISNIDKRRSILQSNNGIFFLIRRVSPTPDIISFVSTTKCRDIYVCKKINSTTRILSGITVNARKVDSILGFGVWAAIVWKLEDNLEGRTLLALLPQLLFDLH
jgi:hypothetical protein